MKIKNRQNTGEATPWADAEHDVIGDFHRFLKESRDTPYGINSATGGWSMSAYLEVELRCDGPPGTPGFHCDARIWGGTLRAVRAEAADAGWQTALPGERDLCPRHSHPSGADQ